MGETILNAEVNRGMNQQVQVLHQHTPAHSPSLSANAQGGTLGRCVERRR